MWLAPSAPCPIAQGASMIDSVGDQFVRDEQDQLALGPGDAPTDEADRGQPWGPPTYRRFDG
jgi:hypothetical protein